MNDNIMVDLETMGTGPNAAIIAIGACYFDIQTGLIGDRFYAVVDLKSSVDAGMTIDADTVLWWLKQSDIARAEFEREGQNISQALHGFLLFVTDKKNVKIWGNGASFDNVILSNGYRICDLPQPWKFWNDRCYRTIKALYPHVLVKRQGTHHNALDRR